MEGTLICDCDNPVEAALMIGLWHRVNGARALTAGELGWWLNEGIRARIGQVDLQGRIV